MTDIHARARQLADKALDTLEQVMDNTLEESKDRIRAAEAILDRGFGKPAQAVIAIPANRRAQIAAAGMTDQELRRVIDAEFEEIPSSAPTPPRQKLLPAHIPTKDPLLE